MPMNISVTREQALAWALYPEQAQQFWAKQFGEMFNRGVNLFQAIELEYYQVMMDNPGSVLFEPNNSVTVSGFPIPFKPTEKTFKSDKCVHNRYLITRGMVAVGLGVDDWNEIDQIYREWLNMRKNMALMDFEGVDLLCCGSIFQIMEVKMAMYPDNNLEQNKLILIQQIKNQLTIRHIKYDDSLLAKCLYEYINFDQIFKSLTVEISPHTMESDFQPL